MSCRRRRRARTAFSLVEIMVVIVIIGLLAGLVTVNVRGYMVRAKREAARTDIATLVKALDTFYTAYDRYPTNDEGLEILARPSEKLPEPPLGDIPTDPWGNPYQYNSPGTNGPYEVICHGANGRDGGDGADADITSDNYKDKG